MFPDFAGAAAAGGRNSFVEGFSFRFHGLDGSVPRAIAFVIDTSRARSGRSAVWIMMLIRSRGSGEALAKAMAAMVDIGLSPSGNRLKKMKNPLGRRAGIHRARYAPDRFG